MEEDIAGKVKDIFSEQLGVDAEKVTPDASFTEDLGADSLDAVELIMAIEEAFDRSQQVALIVLMRDAWISAYEIFRVRWGPLLWSNGCRVGSVVAGDARCDRSSVHHWLSVA